jgi:hypothetical protein
MQATAPLPNRGHRSPPRHHTSPHIFHPQQQLLQQAQASPPPPPGESSQNRPGCIGSAWAPTDTRHSRPRRTSPAAASAAVIPPGVAAYTTASHCAEATPSSAALHTSQQRSDIRPWENLARTSGLPHLPAHLPPGPPSQPPPFSRGCHAYVFAVGDPGLRLLAIVLVSAFHADRRAWRGGVRPGGRPSPQVGVLASARLHHGDAHHCSAFRCLFLHCRVCG